MSGTEEAPDAVQVTASGDRVAAEALALEIRRLARRHGLEVKEVRVRSAEAPAGDADPA